MSNACAWGSHLDDLPGLHGQCGEVSAPVDRDALGQDGVQTPHLVPTQHADTPAGILGISGGHDGRTRLDTRPQRRAAERNATSSSSAQETEREGPVLGQVCKAPTGWGYAEDCQTCPEQTLPASLWFLPPSLWTQTGTAAGLHPLFTRPGLTGAS